MTATKKWSGGPGELLQETLDGYVVWLDKQPLSARSRAAYRRQVAGKVRQV